MKACQIIKKSPQVIRFAKFNIFWKVSVVKDISKWSDSARKPYEDIYGEEYLKWAWGKHLEAREE